MKLGDWTIARYQKGVHHDFKLFGFKIAYGRAHSASVTMPWSFDQHRYLGFDSINERGFYHPSDIHGYYIRIFTRRT